MGRFLNLEFDLPVFLPTSYELIIGSFPPSGEITRSPSRTHGRSFRSPTRSPQQVVETVIPSGDESTFAITRRMCPVWRSWPGSVM